MKIFPFSISSTFVIIAGFALPGQAFAFDPAPLCAYPTAPLEPVSVTPPAPARATAPMCDPAGQYMPSGTPRVEVREALAEARRLAANGELAQAALAMRAVAEAEPDIADRVALEEAAYRMAAGPDAHACAAWERARQSPHRSVALLGRIGHVRCLLATANRAGVEELESLRRSYPELPHAPELDLVHAQALETWGELEEAGQLYRRVDLMFPGSDAAATARARMTALRAGGLDLRDHTPNQRVDRAGRLVSRGPLDMAREEIAALRADPTLPTVLRQQVARIAAQVARHEGRWEEASSLLREARGLPDLPPEDQAAMAERLDDLERAAEDRSREEVVRRLRSITRGQAIERLPTARLFSVLRAASRGGDVEAVDRAMRTIHGRDRMPPGLRLEAALFGAGVGDDALVAALLEAPSRHPTYGVEARYHRARALERLGRNDEALAIYADVIASDSTRLPYYAMWARQRIRAIRPTIEPVPLVAEACRPEGPFSPPSIDGSAKTGPLNRRAATAAAAPTPDVATGDAGGETTTDPPPDPIAEADEAATLLEIAGGAPRTVEMTDAQILAVLDPIAREHGDAFPWFPRAAALIRMGERDAASDELHEAYLAWSEARGRGAARADLEGVLRGHAPPRMRVAPATWRARRLFPQDARRSLARVAAALGDHGMAVRLSGSFSVAGPRPRAYEDLVEAAAARHGVEPELLWAVMRVESIYNPRIISYAGAIGLMQIMPRTGALIASGQGREGYTTDQLLDPATNIDMAAWYLASLIERFDGRLPLAIASYNGGPHNVRGWMRDHSADMPMDAFLERIPFDQTHRYVRRVMTHYEAYLAQRRDVIAPLDTRLPELSPDPVAF